MELIQLERSSPLSFAVCYCLFCVLAAGAPPAASSFARVTLIAHLLTVGALLLLKNYCQGRSSHFVSFLLFQSVFSNSSCFLFEFAKFNANEVAKNNNTAGCFLSSVARIESSSPSQQPP